MKPFLENLPVATFMRMATGLDNTALEYYLDPKKQ